MLFRVSEGWPAVAAIPLRAEAYFAAVLVCIRRGGLTSFIAVALSSLYVSRYCKLELLACNLCWSIRIGPARPAFFAAPARHGQPVPRCVLLPSPPRLASWAGVAAAHAARSALPAAIGIPIRSHIRVAGDQSRHMHGIDLLPPELQPAFGNTPSTNMLTPDTSMKSHSRATPTGLPTP